MRVASFAVTSAVLFGLANGSTCTYGTLTPEKEQAFLDDCGAEVQIQACDAADQAMLEAAIATELYNQCQCVYYDESTAFNYRRGCWQKRLETGGGRCFTTAYKDFYATGKLDAVLNGPDGICVVATTTLPPPEINCVDDADGVLKKFPMHCGMVLEFVGGCDAPTPFWFPYAFGGKKDMYELCPGTCNPACPDPSIPESDSCQDDPNGILAEWNTNCEAMLRHNSCDDPDGIVPRSVPGGTPQNLCPASCDPRCQDN